MDTIPPDPEPDTYYLLKGTLFKGRLDDSWNDYGFHTRYTLRHSDLLKHETDIGVVRLGQFGMGEDQISPNLPEKFSNLNPSKFFSVGEDETYYENIVGVEDNQGYDILYALNDFTVCSDLYDKARNETVTSKSLLRDSKADQVQHFFELLRPPLNLNTMFRIYGSTGWSDVDQGLLHMEQLLFEANTNLYYNAIATIGRQIIKGLANRLYDDDLHRDKSKFKQAPTDDQYINKLCGIVQYWSDQDAIAKNVEEYIKATIRLVQGYVHKEQAEGSECFMGVHAVITLVYQLSIICNKEKYNRIIGKANIDKV
jgi:hypothetical protein